MKKNWILTRDYFLSHLSRKKGDGECHGCCINVEKLSVTLSDAEILRELSFHLHCGTLNLLLGPNGAGKSTLIKTLLGEHSFQGSISFSTTKKNQSKPVIGYVPQHFDLDESSLLTVEDLFKISLAPFTFKKLHPHLMMMLKEVEVDTFIKRKLTSLSGGERQRVLLALALSPMPNLLLLDEPLSGVDKKISDQFFQLLVRLKQNFDLSILMVSHDFERAKKYADRVIYLDKTVLADGAPEEVFMHERFQTVEKEHD